MKQIYTSLLIAIIAFACEQDTDQFTTESSTKLRFSADSVVFDTVFTTVGSVSKRIWVYNDLENAVNISTVSTREVQSNFSITLNGESNNTFENIAILGKDSIQVLITVKIDPKDQNMPFLVNDYLDFTTNGNPQFVNLVAWGQDAYFIKKSILTCNQVWTNERPYVLLDSIVVENGCKLTINSGTKIYASANTAIIVAGSLDAKGTFGDRITITNIRQDEAYRNAPGQWNGVFFTKTSTNNHINCTDIRNAVYGIWLGTPDSNIDPDLVLSNSKIENMSVIGLAAFTSDVYAYNTLINNCGQFVVANLAGGNYHYEHCTFANYSFDFFREEPAVLFSDNLPISDTEVLTDALSVEMTNSIIWGSLENEILLSNAGGQLFDLVLNNNIIKTTDQSISPNTNVFDEAPRFIDPQNYEYQLDTLSVAKDGGAILGIIEDIEGNFRDAKPDIGAYERVE
ncbi:MAG: right-handed parallel beta-helix repeat-containing protein [Cyclobacteriaceae bacterium]|nr:right-handed parallel beta-helix repeat-containing protein [Cyclobacteriaceae bacterium]